MYSPAEAKETAVGMLAEDGAVVTTGRDIILAGMLPSPAAAIYAEDTTVRGIYKERGI